MLPDRNKIRKTVLVEIKKYGSDHVIALTQMDGKTFSIAFSTRKGHGVCDPVIVKIRIKTLVDFFKRKILLQFFHSNVIAPSQSCGEKRNGDHEPNRRV